MFNFGSPIPGIFHYDDMVITLIFLDDWRILDLPTSFQDLFLLLHEVFIKIPLSASKSPRALVTWPSPVQPRRRARGRDQLLGSCFKSRRVYHINNRGVTPSECLLLSVFRIPEIPQSSRSKGTARTQIIRCSIVISLRGHGLLLEPLCGRVKRELSTVRDPRSEEKQLLGEYERSTTDRC